MNIQSNPLQAMQQTFKAEGVRELSVPLHEAAKATQNNNMDEVFFSHGGKDYVAFGAELKFDALHGLEMLSFARNGIEVHHFQDESNSMGEGASAALNSTAGKISSRGITALGAAAGAGLALFAGSMASVPQFVGMGSLLMTTGIGAGIGAAIGYGGTAAVGAASGALSFADRGSIDAITKQ